jgi:ribosomal protein L15
VLFGLQLPLPSLRGGRKFTEVTSLRLMERYVISSKQERKLISQVGTETEQAKNDVLAKKLWDLSVKVLKEKAQYEVKL